MIDHHRGAVSMVDTLLGVDGAAQGEAAFRLASEINVGQTTEIDREAEASSDAAKVRLLATAVRDLGDEIR